MLHTTNAVTLHTPEYLAVMLESTMYRDSVTKFTCKTTVNQERTLIILPCGNGQLHQQVAQLMAQAHQLERHTMRQATILAAATYSYTFNESHLAPSLFFNLETN